MQYLDRGPDVLKLQRYLNAAGFLLAAEGAGAPGEETDFFGSRTFDAVIRFQNAHGPEILAPLGLARATGYFGPASISFANSHPK
jgi:peptidoglycan hydrolase-like protein with peptidoglycan-binding domain